MFTGIITDCGEVISADKTAGGLRLTVRTALDLSATPLGASIACDGCCLTAIDIQGDTFALDVSNETLSKTTLGRWQKGTKINLETSLKFGDELGGHLVSGHIDGLATLEAIKPDGDSYRLTFRVPDALAKYVAPKGSVALNGISLTVNEVNNSTFGVCIIPHTWAVTNLRHLKIGDAVNFEVDLLARYVARILGKEAA
jgi:riboflavin synthase